MRGTARPPGCVRDACSGRCSSFASPGSGQTRSCRPRPLPDARHRRPGNDPDGRRPGRPARRSMGLPDAAARGRGRSGSGPLASPSGRRRVRTARTPAGLPPPHRRRAAGRCSTPRSTRSGNPYRGLVPESALGADHPRRRRRARRPRLQREPVGEQVVVLAHDPGGNWHALEAPPPEVLLPAEGEARRRRWRVNSGGGEIADAAFDEGGHTGLMFAPIGRSVVDGIIRFDGTEWKRDERSRSRPARRSRFQILAIDATGLGNAWAMAEPAESLGERSVVLLERTSTAGGPALGRAPARPGRRSPTATTPARGSPVLAPIGGAAQPLTVTSDGVWIDLTGPDRRGRAATSPSTTTSATAR